MSVVSPATFRRLLGSLDGAEFEAFVADLWAARGREATRRDGFVAVSGGPGEGVHRLVCVPRKSATDRDLESASVDPDVVVCARDSRRLAEAARARDARFVGPDDLRTMLLYGLDRAAAQALVETHFGRSLVGPTAVDSGHWPQLAADWSRFGSAAAVVFLAAVLVVGGLYGLPDGVDTGVTATPAPVAGTTQPTTPVASDAGYPPGFDASGVTDADALAVAHRRAVADRTYDLLVLHQGSVDLLDPGRAWATSRQTVDRVGPTRFHYRVTGIDVAAADNESLVIYDDYADGETTYRRVAGTPSVTYRRGPLPGAAGGAFTALGEAYVARFLATTESRIEVIERPNQTRYRVTATGSPLRIGWPVANYTAVAVVSEDGLVHRLAVEYTRLEPTGTHPDGSSVPDRYAGLDDEVRFELVYRDLDETSAPSPPWYDEARQATNETVLLRPPDSLWWTQPIGIDYDRA